jgi:hypothetical protein
MPDDDNLRTVYRELCTSYHNVDDFRMKLLGLLPLATGTGVILLSDALTDEKKREFAKQFTRPIGAFGFVITLGLLCYELYGIKKCHRLIQAGKGIEGALGVQGQFTNRPREVFGAINEPFAAGVIYPAVLAVWVYLAGFFAWPNVRWIALAVFVVGFLSLWLFNILLRWEVRWI